MNRQSEAIWGFPRDKMVGRFNVLHDEQSKAAGVPQMFAAVIRGQSINLPPQPYNRAGLGLEGIIWTQSTIFPIRDSDGKVGFVGVLRRDMTAEMEKERQIKVADETLRSQQAMIESLASPVVNLWDGILLLPLVGTIDSYRSTTITSSLLTAIGEQQATVAILDVTGVAVIDTAVARYLIAAARSAQLLGCSCAMVGIRSEIAQTIVQLGIDLSFLTTLADLSAAMRWAFQRRGLRIVRA